MIVRRTTSLRVSDVDGRAPRGVHGVGEVRAELVEHAAARADVAVHDVDEDSQAGGVGGVDEAGQCLGTAVGVLDRRPEHAVVAPVVVTGELVERHQLDVRDAEARQPVELLAGGVQRPGGRERPDVQLVQDRVLERRRGPAVVVPGEARRVDDRRGAVDAVGLPTRRRIGERRAAVEADAVAVAVAEPFGDTDPRARGVVRLQRQRPTRELDRHRRRPRRPHLEAGPPVDHRRPEPPPHHTPSEC
jgi:hypothetical protein